MKIVLSVVVRWWKILGKENLYGQWLGQGCDNFFAGVGNGINSIGRQIRPEKQCDSGDVYQHNNDEVDDEFKILA
jgi:hypothetical protein